MLQQARSLMFTLLLALIVSCFTSQARAWHQEGHQAISRAAAMSLPDVAPVFLRDGAATIAHYSVDPDLVRIKPMTQLSAANSPNHYFDLERVDLANLSLQRYAFVAALAKRNLDVRDVGLGLYAIVEARQKLTIALAEYRKWPENKVIQAKCLVYAGELAHYAGDMAQPLHTTIDFDGRSLKNGRSPHSGIHEKVDGLLRRLPAAMLQPPEQFSPKALPQGLEPVLEYIKTTHTHVDEVYELEPLLPAMNDDDTTRLDPKVQAFAKARFDAAVRFTANLFFSAWEDSATIELPAWLKREADVQD